MYEIIQYDDGVIVESDGNEIYRYTGDGYLRDEVQSVILEDANFGSPQKEALSALLGLMDVQHVDEPMPDP